MTEDEKRLEEKLDQVIAALPIIYALGDILVERTTVNKALNLGKNTLEQNPKVKKFQPAGIRKTLVQVSDISVLEIPKNKKRRSR